MQSTGFELATSKSCSERQYQWVRVPRQTGKDTLDSARRTMKRKTKVMKTRSCMRLEHVESLQLY